MPKDKDDELERPVDVFVGPEGSLTDLLRRRRRAVESGDPAGKNEVAEPEGEDAEYVRDGYRKPK